MSLRQNPGGEGEKNHPSKFRQNQEKCNDIAFDKILSKQNIECVFCELSSTINHSKIFELISQLYKCCPFIVNSRSKTSIDRTLPESSSYSHCLFWLSPSAPRISLHSINNLLKLTLLTSKLPVLGGFLFERRPSVPYFERQLLARALHRGKSPSCGQHVAHSKDDWSSCPQGLWGVLWWTDVFTLFVKQKQLTILQTEYKPWHFHFQLAKQNLRMSMRSLFCIEGKSIEENSLLTKSYVTVFMSIMNARTVENLD